MKLLVSNLRDIDMNIFIFIHTYLNWYKKIFAALKGKSKLLEEK